MTLDQEDLDAIVGALLQVPTGKILNDETGAVYGPPASLFQTERATVTGLFDQTVNRVGVVGLLGAEGDYAGQKFAIITGAFRTRSIAQHTIQPSGAGDIHVFTLSIPLGRPAVPNEIIQLC